VNTVGDRLFVMDKWRYHPGVEMLRDLSRSGKLGEVLGLRLRRMGWSNPHTDVDASWILLPHDLTIALEILGRVPNITGATGIVTDGAVRAAWIHADVSGVSVASEISVEARHRERSIVVYGTEGTATLADPLADHIELLPLSVPFTDPPTHKQISISMEFPLIRELRSFVDYLNGGIPSKSSAVDGAAVVASISRVRELIGLESASG
jgi:predicted dehydrogenase